MRSRHILVTQADPADQTQMIEWIRSTLGQQMFDVDVLDREGSLSLKARDAYGLTLGYLPVQRPLMMESLALRHPYLSECEQSLVMTRLAEHAIEHCHRVNAGEVYFLCQNAATEQFARRHHFREVKLPLYRFNLREWERSE